MSTNIRKIALELLRSYEEEKRYVNLLLNSPKLRELTKEENSALTALLYTAVEKKLTYDYIISSFAGRPIDSLDPYVRDILRLGLCQILDMKSIPDFAAVNESVKLARHKGESGFINAVLRRAVKDKENLPFPKREKNLHRFLSVYYSIPYATVKFFASFIPEEELEELFSAFSSESAFSVTVNEVKISREDLIKKLSEYSPEETQYTDNGIKFCKSISPKSLPGFCEGEFFVQDESSRIASAVLDAKAGQTVIDVCAAPGGKSLAAAIKVGNQGKVYSFDLHKTKLSLIEESVNRLGLTNVNVSDRDATVSCEALHGKADRVICDVPCSGLGVFSKKPDLRYKDISTIKDLSALQYEILSESAKYLKPGGVIVYSTCTLNPDENQGVTDKFIENHGDFSYEPIELKKINSEKGYITLYPHKHGTDGFYIAKLRKK